MAVVVSVAGSDISYLQRETFAAVSVWLAVSEFRAIWAYRQSTQTKILAAHGQRVSLSNVDHCSLSSVVAWRSQTRY